MHSKKTEIEYLSGICVCVLWCDYNRITLWVLWMFNSCTSKWSGTKFFLKMFFMKFFRSAWSADHLNQNPIYTLFSSRCFRFVSQCYMVGMCFVSGETQFIGKDYCIPLKWNARHEREITHESSVYNQKFESAVVCLLLFLFLAISMTHHHFIMHRDIPKKVVDSASTVEMPLKIIDKKLLLFTLFCHCHCSVFQATPKMPPHKITT